MSGLSLEVEKDRLILTTSPAYRLPEIKQATGAKWDATRQAWSMAPTRLNVLLAKELAGRALTDIGPKAHDLQWVEKLAPYDGREDLYPFQYEAISRMLATDALLVCMSPGLGKTAVASIVAQEVGGRVLVVAPLSLVYTWRREAKQWAGLDLEIAHTTPPTTDHVVTNYETVARHSDWLKGRWDTLIVDESVLIKNPQAKRTKALLKLRARAGRVYLLSGNPTTRYADDLFAQMQMLRPSAFRSYWRFAERFCVLEDSVWARSGKQVIGTRTNRDLAYELGDLMYVVNQENVLDLPEYLFETVDVPLGAVQQRLYDQVLSDFYATLDGEQLSVPTILAQLTRLQQVTSNTVNLFPDSTPASAKVDALVDLFESGHIEKPAIVWTHWKAGGDYAAVRLGGVHVSGDLPHAKREEVFDAFRAGEVDTLVLSLGVGKFGHTFTNARTIVYLDKTFSADDYFQSLRRVRRIGLTHSPVVLTLRAPGTIDELVEANLAGKMPSIAQVTNSQLHELLGGLNGR